ncbi:peptidase S9 prolyl oligopeptidase [Catenovulum agarivorans DS-2]|uniref:Peptidase S9 prolyl oligopeptidase n=1 Tax=Catenovulum agarivorans DS-2 TaxID=1328313 RepID=W7Q8E8_9ALTE|nr:prolyl oligopeptidase family serine peptidase [Catenovulum agarivorans]EWH08281.1 peptidase S9 prolyl oligopeptidase [Catenovulum agarivorans DS-2]
MSLFKKLIFMVLLAASVIVPVQAETNQVQQQIFASASIATAALNPAGTLGLFYGYEKSKAQLFIFDSQTQTSKQIFSSKLGQKTRIQDAVWVDDKTIYFRLVDTCKSCNQFKQFFVFVDERLNSQLESFNTRGYLINPLRDKANQLMYAAWVRQNTKYQLEAYKVTVEDIIKSRFKRDNRIADHLTDVRRYWADDNNQLRFAQSHDKEELLTTYWLLDEDNDWQKLEQIDSRFYEFTPIGLLANGALAVLTNIKSDKVALYEYNWQERDLGKLIYQHADYDLISAEQNTKNKQIDWVGYYQNGEYVKHYFSQQLADKQALLERSFAPDNAYIVSSNNADDKHVLLITSSNNSGKYYLYNQTSQRAFLLGAKYETHQNFEFQPSQTLQIKHPDGHQVEAYLTLANPQTDKKVLLVNPHGGPIGIRDTQHFSRTTHYLSQIGYSILKVNFRGSEGFGRAHKNAGRGQFGIAIEEDIMAALKLVKQQYQFNKTCSMGGSYGGYSAAILVIDHPTEFDCAIARFGVFDLNLLLNDINFKQEENIQRIIGEVVGTDKALHQSRSPVNLANKVSVPILLTAGLKDQRATAEHTKRFEYMLKKHGKAVESYYMPDVWHGHRNRETMLEEIDVIEAFLQRVLNH